MKRRHLFTCLGISALATLLVGCSKPESQSSSETLQSQASDSFEKKIKWKMVTSWPKNFPGLGMGPES